MLTDIRDILVITAVEEVALRMEFIDRAQRQKLVARLGKSDCGAHLKLLAQG